MLYRHMCYTPSYIDFRSHFVVFLQDTLCVLFSCLLFLTREVVVETIMTTFIANAYMNTNVTPPMIPYLRKPG